MDLFDNQSQTKEDRSYLPTLEHLSHLYILDSLKGLGPQKAKLLFKAEVPLSEVIADPRLLAIPGKTGEGLREQLRSVSEATRTECFKRAEKQIKTAESVGASILTYASAFYPWTVFDSNNPIPVLYVRGSRSLLTADKTVACVGSRNIRDPYTDLLAAFATNAVATGFTVVSGFALGADTVGHRTAVESGGRTICVMPSGLDRPFPPENRTLWQKFLEGDQAVFVSEFAFGTSANALNLRKRNKLIVAFAQGVMVGQSAVDGGAMNAYRFALEQKKPVATFADDNTSDTSGNKLIATSDEGQGTAFNLNEKDPEGYTQWLHRLSSSI